LDFLSSIAPACTQTKLNLADIATRDTPGLKLSALTGPVNCARDYPSQSLRAHEEGETVTTMILGTDGVPSQVTVQTSSGSEWLDAVAITCVMRFRYRPAELNGKPVVFMGHPVVVWRMPPPSVP
jgi:protein TonB